MKKYSKEYLSEFFEYDETSPSCLRWKKKWKSTSPVEMGQVAGSLDKKDHYWRIHALGGYYKAHKIVWAILRGDDQSGLIIDHRDGDPSNNKIDNLRLVDRETNAQNKIKHRNNNTGITGVAYSEGFTRKGTPYSKYTAHIYYKAKKISATFSVQKYGKEEALKLAIQWREDKIYEYTKEGKVNFTERHGK